MAEYRIFLIGDDDHIIGPPYAAPFVSDSAALLHAMSMESKGKAAEVWQGPRKLGRFAIGPQAEVGASTPSRQPPAHHTG